MLFMNIIKSASLGIIEGITEWLPISSTGHLILADQFIQLDTSTEFISIFNVVIQLGAILAVVILYFHKLNPFSPSKSSMEKKETWLLWFKVIVACIPAIIMGFLLDDYLEEHFYKFLPVAIVLIIYGITFIIVEKWNKNETPKWTSLNDVTHQSALIVGLFQVLALVPGTSRSGATILGAILIGASRFVATEFSFFVGIPIMFGASSFKIIKYLAAGNNFNMEEILVLFVGTIVSFLISVLAIQFLLRYLELNDFTAFGWYRIILGIILIGYWFIIM